MESLEAADTMSGWPSPPPTPRSRGKVAALQAPPPLLLGLGSENAAASSLQSLHAPTITFRRGQVVWVLQRRGLRRREALCLARRDPGLPELHVFRAAVAAPPLCVADGRARRGRQRRDGRLCEQLRPLPRRLFQQHVSLCARPGCGREAILVSAATSASSSSSFFASFASNAGSAGGEEAGGAGAAPIPSAASSLSVPTIWPRTLWLLHPDGAHKPPTHLVTPVNESTGPVIVVRVALVRCLVPTAASGAGMSGSSPGGGHRESSGNGTSDGTSDGASDDKSDGEHGGTPCIKQPSLVCEPQNRPSRGARGCGRRGGRAPSRRRRAGRRHVAHLRTATVGRAAE